MPIAGEPQNEEKVLLEIQTLLDKLEKATVPPNLKEETKESLVRLNRAMQHGVYQQEYEQTAKYVEWVLRIPWTNVSQDNLDIKTAKDLLDKSHYGLESIKSRILEYLSVLKLQSEKGTAQKINSRNNVICFVGLPGTGKTSFAASIAQSLGRKFGRIPMGGLSNPMVLRGQPRAFPQAEPGAIIRTLAQCGTKNPVILLDEIDSISGGAESDVMGVLLELLDPEQNQAFTDYYINFPVDLSQVFFIASANRMGNITSAVMDRLETIIMPRYTDEDKVVIARDYIYPRELQNSGVDPAKVKFAPDIWPRVIKPFGYDIDIRNIQRTVNGMLRKVARKVVEENVPLVEINEQNYRDYLPQW
ncbi:MAG TPA: AAA family ATPase [Candidatus Saccharimonadales bacterium]|nr:AAA family ATPase [Candidatus Saccharimonadales bacterium]